MDRGSNPGGNCTSFSVNEWVLFPSKTVRFVPLKMPDIYKILLIPRIIMVIFIFASFSCFFRGRVKCRKFSFWHFFGHNSRKTRRGNSDQIFEFLDRFHIRLGYLCEKIFPSFIAKQITGKIRFYTYILTLINWRKKEFPRTWDIWRARPMSAHHLSHLYGWKSGFCAAKINEKLK